MHFKHMYGLSISLLSYTVATQVKFHFRSAKIFRVLFPAPARRRYKWLVTFYFVATNTENVPFTFLLIYVLLHGYNM